MPYVVRLHNKYIPELPKKVFSYSHPKATLEGNNSYRQSKTLSWEMSKVCRIHGFAGYFHCCLYKDVTMSIHPQMHTPKMHRYLNQKGSTKFNFKYSASPDLWIFHFPKIRPQIGVCPQIGWKSTNRVSGGFHSYYRGGSTITLGNFWTEWCYNGHFVIFPGFSCSRCYSGNFVNEFSKCLVL